MLDAIGETRPKFLIFLAPYTILYPVEQLMRQQRVITDGVRLGYLGWQDITDVLLQLDAGHMPQWQRMIIGDLCGLLVKKRFVRFNGFSPSLLKAEITDESYLFASETLQQQLVYAWPTTAIGKESGYVYGAR